MVDLDFVNKDDIHSERRILKHWKNNMVDLDSENKVDLSSGGKI